MEESLGILKIHLHWHLHSFLFDIIINSFNTLNFSSPLFLTTLFYHLSWLLIYSPDSLHLVWLSDTSSLTRASSHFPHVLCLILLSSLTNVIQRTALQAARILIASVLHTKASMSCKTELPKSPPSWSFPHLPIPVQTGNINTKTHEYAWKSKQTAEIRASKTHKQVA